MLTADEIRNARFSTSFRGYDNGEVRTFLARVAASYAEVAGALDGSESRLTILAAPLDTTALVETAPTDGSVSTEPVFDHAGSVDSAGPAASASTVDGDGNGARAGVANVDAEAVAYDAQQVQAQTSELLAAARNEAHAIVAKANDEAARIILRARAESRGRPTGEGSALVEAAFAETPSDPTLAREQARLMISEAKAVRERILTDLAKRRKSAHIQLEQLRVAREKLLESLRDARRVVDDASRDLSTAEVEARLAAEMAGRRVAAEPEPTAAELDIELTGAGHLTRAFHDLATDRVLVADLALAEPVIAEPVIADVAATTDAADRAGVEPVATDTAAAVLQERTIDLRADRDMERPGEPAASVWTGTFAPPTTAATVVDATVTAAPDDTNDERESRTAAPSVDALFARLRAEREQASASARDVLGRTDNSGTADGGRDGVSTDGAPGSSKPKRAKAPSTKKDRPAPSNVNSVQPSGQSNDGRAAVALLDAPESIVIDLEAIAADSHPGVLRDRMDRPAPEHEPDERMLFVTGPLQSQLVRAVKRYLQDEQSTALAVLRTARGRVNLDLLIGAAAEHRRRVGDAVSPMFCDAFRAGLDPSSPQPEAMISDHAAIHVHVVADQILTVVREEIGAGVAASASPESDSGRLTEAISTCYRAWTTDRINALSAEPLLAAFRAGRNT